MKKIIYVMVLVILSSTCYAIDGYIHLNESTSNKTLSLEVTLADGETLYVQQLTDSVALSYAYPSVINYNNETVKNIDFTISKNKQFLENEVIVSIFELSNSLNSNVFNYTITTNVTVESVVEIIEESYINVLNGDYIINYSTNVLPKSDNLSYRISGLKSTQLNITCDEGWLACPESKTFDSDGIVNFQVSYEVPTSAKVGTKEYNINLTTSNITLVKRVIFNIIEPDISFQNFQMDSNCFTSTASGADAILYSCYLESEQYNIKRLYDMYEQLKSLDNESCEVVANHTEYIYVGNVEEDILNEVTRCRQDRDEYLSQSNDKTTEISELRRKLTVSESEYKSCNEKLLQNETKCLETVFATSVKMKRDAEALEENIMQEAKDYRTSTHFKIFGTLLFIGVIVGLMYYRQSSKKAGWTI